MGPTETGLFILGSIVVMAMAAFLVQSIETARRQRHMRIIHLKDHFRRADHLFKGLPKSFVTPEIMRMLLKYMEQQISKLIEIEQKPEYQQELDRITELTNSPFEPEPYPTGQLTHYQDRNSTRRARAMLRELAQFIKDLQKTHQGNSAILSQMLTDIKQGYTRLTVELEIMDAQETEALAGEHVSLHQYRTAMIRLQQFNNTHKIDPQIFALSQKVERCQHAAEKIRMEQEAIRKEEQAAKDKIF